MGVLGAGSWGSALAVHYAAHGHEVLLWARDAEVADRLRSERRNPRYLADCPLPPSVAVTSEIGDASDLDRVLLVVPSHALREVVRELLAAGPADPDLRRQGRRDRDARPDERGGPRGERDERAAD
jgi:glycerol-3-phosphate dehydrogenase (NAD(P)+)